MLLERVINNPQEFGGNPTKTIFLRNVFPTHVGVILVNRQSRSHSSYSPHIPCGDDPGVEIGQNRLLPTDCGRGPASFKTIFQLHCQLRLASSLLALDDLGVPLPTLRGRPLSINIFQKEGCLCPLLFLTTVDPGLKI